MVSKGKQVMRLDRIAGIFFWIVIMSAAAVGQQGSDTTGQPREAPVQTVTTRTYPGGGLIPWRRVQTRRESGSRETVIETEETSTVDANWEPVQEIVTETIRTRPSTAQSR